MNRFKSVLLAALWALLLTGPALAGDLKATFIANEGYLLEAGGRKVLVDALMGEYPQYVDLSPETREEVEGAKGRFEGVDLVLTTHKHDDHFSPEAVARHLKANPKAVYVSTPQAVALLEKTEGYEAIRSRVRSPFPKEGERIEFDDFGPGLSLEVLNLHHGRGGDPPTQNLGFLIHLGGFKILHVGDTSATAEEFAVNDLHEDGIDLAMLPDWLLLYDKWEGLLETIRPRHTAAIHFDVSQGPEHFKKLERAVPGVVALREELASKTFSKSAE